MYSYEDEMSKLILIMLLLNKSKVKIRGLAG